MPKNVLVKLADVERTYKMGEVSVPVLKKVNLEVSEGEFLVIVGPSGSGKTTMLNLIGGLDQPNAGSVEIAGEELSSLGKRKLAAFRRKIVGFVFQLYNLISTLTAEENVALASEMSPNPLDPGEALEMVGLGERKEHFPSQLSGGEQQRVAIARALAKKPRLLLCDEPTGALDFETGKRILALLRTVNRDLNMTIIVITHNGAIGDMADRVVRLRSGEIVESTVNEHPLDPEEIVW
ncbi:ABC-type antimicrobial peptide transport system ATPase component [Planctomycetales bacterium 10988]|nr:ABC-type antimicrobial peptide transport system ATPase component [Planctomycetales bacterium 10988]